jgi:hypothetical protein
MISITDISRVGKGRRLLIKKNTEAKKLKAKKLFCSQESEIGASVSTDIESDVEVPAFDDFQQHLSQYPGPGKRMTYDRREWKLVETPGSNIVKCEWIKDRTHAGVFEIYIGVSIYFILLRLVLFTICVCYFWLFLQVASGRPWESCR